MSEFSNTYSNISSQYLHDGDMNDSDSSSHDEFNDSIDDTNNINSNPLSNNNNNNTTNSNSSNKKSRISQACDSCRRRKRRCDGYRPVCSPCSKLSMECIYPQITKKRGPEAGVVKRLRNEVKQLENELKQEQLLLQQNHIMNSNSNTTTTVNDQINTQSNTLNDKDTATNNNVNSLHSIIQPLTTNIQRLQEHSKFYHYITQYFQFINSNIFPYFNYQLFIYELDKYKPYTKIDTPVTFNLRLGGILAYGHYISDNNSTPYFTDCVQYCRTAAAEVFDIASVDIIRGLLLLVNIYIQLNETHKSACILAICARLIEITRSNDPSPNDSNELINLYNYNDNILNISNWLYHINYQLYTQSNVYQSQIDKYLSHQTLYNKIVLYYARQHQNNGIKMELLDCNEIKNYGIEYTKYLNKIKLLQLFNELCSCKFVISSHQNLSIYKQLTQLIIYENTCDCTYLQLIIVLFCRLIYTINLNDKSSTMPPPHPTNIFRYGLNDHLLQYYQHCMASPTQPIDELVTCMTLISLQYDISHNIIYNIIYYVVACIQIEYRLNVNLLYININNLYVFNDKYAFSQPLYANIQQKLQSNNIVLNNIQFNLQYQQPSIQQSLQYLQQRQQQSVIQSPSSGSDSTNALPQPQSQSLYNAQQQQQQSQPSQLQPQSSIDYTSHILLPNNNLYTNLSSHHQYNSYNNINSMLNYQLPSTQIPATVLSHQPSGASSIDYNNIIHKQYSGNTGGNNDNNNLNQMVQRYLNNNY